MRSTGRVRFFVEGLRSGAGDAVPGALPVGFQPLERSAYTLVGDLTGDDPLLEADLGSQFPGPGATLFAKIAGTAMRASSFSRTNPSSEKRVCRRWGREEPSCSTARPQALKPWMTLRTGCRVASQLPGHADGPLSSGTRSQDLAAAQHKGIPRTQSRLDLLPFVRGQRADTNGCSHALFCITFPTASGGNALGRRHTMFCSQCGASNADDALFCQKCGKRFETTASEESTLLSPPPTVPASPYGSYSYESTANESTEPKYPPPPPDLPYGGLSNPYEQQSIPLAPPLKQKSRRVLWIVLSSIGVIVLLVAAWVIYANVNQSTPSKTLQAGCDATKSGDYQAQYNLFSSGFQSHLGTEGQYASAQQQAVTSKGGIVNCSFSNVNESGSSASAVAVKTFGDGSTITFDVQLVDENGVWKMSNVTQRTP
jgi:zinc-ribbon domain